MDESPDTLIEMDERPSRSLTIVMVSNGFVIDDNWGQKTYVALGTAGDLYRITDGILKAWMPEENEPF